MARTPNADWLREATRLFTETDPTLSELLTRTTHTAWPIGFYACRPKTSGSGNWSDHAWGNALDIMKLSKWDDPDDPAKGNAQPGQPHYLDIIWEWLNTNKDPFDLRDSQMLWRVSMHYNHIHVSFNHRATGTPPCNGGDLVTINPAGGWVLTIDPDDPHTPPQPPVEEDPDMPVMFTADDPDERWEPYCWTIYESITGNTDYATYGATKRTLALDLMDAEDVFTPSQTQLDHIWAVTGYPGTDAIKSSGAQMTQFVNRVRNHKHESDDATGGVVPL